MRRGAQAAALTSATADLRVAHLGTSSVRDEIGILKNEENASRADSHLVHVLAEKAGQRPTRIAWKIRAALMGIRVRG